MQGVTVAPSWTESDKQILVENYDSTKATVRRLSRLLNRTSDAIISKAYQLGLVRHLKPRTHRPWERQEIELLQEHAGVLPFNKVCAAHSDLCRENGWTGRSKNAVSLRINLLGVSRSVDGMTEYYTSESIATALRCSPDIVRGWYKDKVFASILMPQKEHEATGKYIVSRKNLASFFRKYPGELSRCRPDIAWLISLVCEKG